LGAEHAVYVGVERCVTGDPDQLEQKKSDDREVSALSGFQ